MAKIRGIKPDFWTDEAIVELSIAARLLFIGMWNFACDNGHVGDKPRQLKMRILPGDDVNVDDLLEELVKNERIVRSAGVITILKFAHHQKPHARWWSTCELTKCDKPGGATPIYNGGPTVGNGESREKTAVVDGDGDGDGDGDSTVTARPRKRAKALPDDLRPSQSHIDLANSLGIDLRAEWAQFVDHHRAKGSTMKDWDAALRTWIRNAAKFRKNGSAPIPVGINVDPTQLPPVQESWMRRRPQ